MKLNLRQTDKKDLKDFLKSKEVQNNKKKVAALVEKRLSYGEFRY